MRPGDGRRHELGRFIRSVAEHHALISRSLRARIGLVYGPGNFSGLLLKSYVDSDMLRRKAAVVLHVSNVRNGGAGQGFDFAMRQPVCRAHFTGNTDVTLRYQCLTGHARAAVACQIGVEHSITDSICDFIPMSFAHGFAGQDQLTHRFRLKKNNSPHRYSAAGARL